LLLAPALLVDWIESLSGTIETEAPYLTQIDDPACCGTASNPAAARPNSRKLWISALPVISAYSGRFDRQAGGLPFGIAVLEPTDEIAPLSQGGDRFERENAIGAAAIGDHFPIRL
jgi:hypothetical protein